MNCYTKVLAKYANKGKMELPVDFEVQPDGGLRPHQVEEAKATLRELGLDDDVRPVN